MVLSLSDMSEELGGDTLDMVLGGYMEGGGDFVPLFSCATHIKKFRYEVASSTYNSFAPAPDFVPCFGFLKIAIAAVLQGSRSACTRFLFLIFGWSYPCEWYLWAKIC